MVGRFEEIKV